MDCFAHSGQHLLDIPSATSKDDIMVRWVTALSMGTGIYTCTANKNPTEFNKFGEAGLIVAPLKGNAIQMANSSSTPFDRGDTSTIKSTEASTHTTLHQSCCYKSMEVTCRPLFFLMSDGLSLSSTPQSPSHLHNSLSLSSERQ
jgi:hypothetical protein